MGPDIKKGDRVRVVIEGEVLDTSGRDLVVGAGWADSSVIPQDPNGHTVTVEKIEPPVEVFAPGDVVRHKDMRSVYALTDKGFVRLSGYGYMPVPNGTEVPFANATTFTSVQYERVDLE